MHRNRTILLIPILLLTLLTACGAATTTPDTSQQRLNVVATTGQIADTVANVGGDQIKLTTLLGPGIDPHSYVPTEGNMTTLQNAQIIFYNGLHLEARMDRVLQQIAQNSNVTVVAVAETLPELSLLSWEPEAGMPYDPHVWNDVRLWIQVTEIIRDTLVTADPAHAEIYTANAATYIEQLQTLHNDIQAAVSQIPQERRVLVTAHDAFGYFGRAYGFAVEAVQGISTETEASTADIQALASLVVERQVPAIFIETTISPRTIEAVQAAVRAAGHEVKLGGELFSDAIGEPGTPAGTYIGMMRHNTDTIVAALQ